MTASGMQYVDVRDVATAHRMLLERRCPERATDARYLLAGRYAEWEELAELLEAAAGIPLRRVRVNPRLLRAAGTICDVIKHVIPFTFPFTREGMEYATRWTPASNAKLEAELGLTPRDLQETLRDTIAWLRSAGHLDPL